MSNGVTALTDLFPTIVVAGTATKMTQSMFGSPATKTRRVRKGSRKSNGYASAPTGISKKYSPW